MDTISHPSLLKLGNRIANRVLQLWLRTHGADISHLRAELAEEAIGGLSVALVEAGIPLANLELDGGQLPRAVIRAGFRAAQSTLRKFTRQDSYDTAYHPDMELHDHVDKDLLAAAFDASALRQKRRAIIAKARRMVAGTRAYAAENPSQRARQTLRADLKVIARATHYMLACVLEDSSRPFDFRNVFVWSKKDHGLYDAAQKRTRRTVLRSEQGAELLARAAASRSDAHRTLEST